jgi:hypothetical protein
MAAVRYSDRVRTQDERMRQAMERLNIEPAFAAAVDGGLAWHEARTKCIFCSNTRRCRDWLAASGPIAAFKRFCPNADYFRDCLSEMPRHRQIAPTDCP